MNYRVHINDRIGVALLFGVMLFVFALWKSPYFTPTTTVTNTKPITHHLQQQSLLQTEAYKRDTDGDGVPDWKERLLGLDPAKKDTNGDGISDAQQVAQAEQTLANALPTSSKTPQTDTLARTIFGTYIQTKQQGTYNPKTFKYVVAQAVDTPFSSSVLHTYTYTKKDIHTVKATEVNIRKYRTDFSNALEELRAIPEYEFTTLSRAYTQKNEADFATLRDDAKIYMHVRDALASITVPETLIDSHIELLHAYTDFAKTLSSIAKNHSDPVEELVMTRDFLTYEDAIKAVYSKIAVYFTINNINTL